jgi:apolipoprotein D and lipocalin family protein
MKRYSDVTGETRLRLMTLIAQVFAFLVAFTVVAPSRAGDRLPLETVDSVDLERYLGRWYEIASYPMYFQRGCTATTADYSLRKDGLIEVINSCRKESVDGKLKQAKGRAKIVDPTTNAKLKVSFFGPFWGPYWIIDLDPDYQWAVVGVPSRKYLWILSRSPRIDTALYDEILARLPAKGYDPAGLNRTLQPEPGAGDNG